MFDFPHFFSGEKPYKCRFCPFSSISATNLKGHMKNHTNKLPFGCGQCNLGFKLKIDLSKHCETAHNGIVVLQERNDIEGGEVAAATFTNEVNETKVEEIKLKQNEDQEELHKFFRANTRECNEKNDPGQKIG